ncbi:laccase [Leucogyrophana mollusca]|uniref:Laccase n=1 Tax=Leucogyrophana mollusca TaxID=85980 RepID=A0ACB8B8Q8_9AGAM|nr:laccase [Leucogyrophana mollusca]
MKLLLACLFSLSARLPCVASVGPVTHLIIKNANISPDGFTRSQGSSFISHLFAIVVNGVQPGIVISGNKGDRFQINVQNLLSDESMNMSTSHWHGIFQHRNNAMDGTSFVTQCPISPGHTYHYNFTATGQAGTFWYHSHYSVQYCDGLRGPLIIYDPQDPHLDLYDVDDESTIITLMDWYHIPALQVQGEAAPDSTLINGRGRYNGGPLVPLTVLTVAPGKRYRFRLLSMACKANCVFSIDDHNFTIVEADGEPTEPLVVDSIQILAGQRYSIILEANQPADNYWVRAKGNYDFSFDNGQNSAILRYAGAPSVDPMNRTWSATNPLDETQLHAFDHRGVPGLPEVGGADVVLNLVSVFNETALEYEINGVVYQPPSTPILLQILSGAMSAPQLLPHGSVYTLPPHKVIEVSMPGGASESPHPFHLHGHKFDVVRSAGSSSYNFVNPVRRDTVNTGNIGDNVTVRFTTDNAGPWFLHCHIDWHLLKGMAVVFAEDTHATASDDTVTGEWEQLCKTYDSLPPSQH